MALWAAVLVEWLEQLISKGAGGPLSPQEQAALQGLPAVLREPSGHGWIGPLHPEYVKEAWARGEDPLGEAWLASAPRPTRYRRGMVYTPGAVVRAMVEWVVKFDPVRIVDPGCGSGRFAAEAARRLPDAEIVAIDVDPVATLLTRAWLGYLGHRRARVIHLDYRRLTLEPVGGRTAFIGNPPYVRHHQMSAEDKTLGQQLAGQVGLQLSGLAGLHVHFLLATARLMQPGDVGCFITGTEWMQAGYGSPVRDLLAERLGLRWLHLLHPSAQAFDGVQTTAAVFGFEAGSRHRFVRVTTHRSLHTLGYADGHNREVARDALKGCPWTPLITGNGQPRGEPNGVPLRSIARVHRGIATGANHFFVMTEPEARQRGLLPWVRPVLTDAREVLNADGIVRKGPTTKVLLCPSRDVDLKATEAAPLAAYLRQGEGRGIHHRYLCRHRRPWWFLGHLEAPPLVATYMARRPPAFALNPDGLLILNVFHGIYPTRPLAPDQLQYLATYLQTHRQEWQGHGRIYQGGLEKFEPRELEALVIPASLVPGDGPPGAGVAHPSKRYRLPCCRLEAGLKALHAWLQTTDAVSASASQEIGELHRQASRLSVPEQDASRALTNKQ